MNFGNVEAFVRNDDWDGLSHYMRTKINGLVAGGADVILCVSNTLHKPLEDLMVEVPVPMIHIADPTGAAMKSDNLSKVAIFGTKPVMEMSYLKDRFKDYFGIQVMAPTEAEQRDIDQIIFDELVKNTLAETSKTRFLDIADRMRREDGVEGLILGCTEIFLLIDQKDRPDFPMYNTARLHCEAAVDFALS